MKKINVSTVKQLADVEVIFMTTHFVATTINTAHELRAAIEEVDNCIRCTPDDYYMTATMAHLQEVDKFFTELEIAFGIKDEPKDQPSKPEPMDATVEPTDHQ